MKRSTVHFALLAGLATLGAACAQANAAKLVLMHYMPWFETPDVRGSWGGHWAGFNGEADPDVIDPTGRRDIWSHYYPLIDVYDSTDADVVECQLLQMKLAGIDGVIADWYGLSSEADYAEIHDATQVLFAETLEAGMLFAACFEDRSIELRINRGSLQPNQIQQDMNDMFAWMQANWFTSPHYVQRNNRPLLLNFGPIYLSDPAVWDNAFNALPVRPNFFPLHNLWTTLNADGGFQWVHASAWQGSPSESQVRLNLNTIFNSTSSNPAQVIPSAAAGFDDVYEPGGRFPFLDHNNGITLRQALDFGIDGPWDTVQLVTWNDYTEGTMIEPTREFGYTFLEVIQNARRSELQFDPAGPLAFSANDLRLPALLLQMRRDQVAPEAELDAVATFLNSGDTASARDAIAALTLASPVAALADAGGTLAFSAASSLSDVSYQWYLDGVALTDDARISGATTAVLSITGAGAADAGLYTLGATAGEIESLSQPAIGAVRGSDLGRADLDNDGDADIDDVTAFLNLFETGGS